MIRFERLAVTTTLFLLGAAPGHAQMGMRSGPPQMHGVWSPVVGKGAVYDVTSSEGKKHQQEIAVVGKETVEGKDGYWMQMAINNEELGGQMVMKHLFVLDGQETRSVKTIMQFPGRPPMEMPAQMGRRERASQSADVRSEAQDLGSESVTVPAGTFRCEHYRTKDGGDVWVSSEVPPWGLVKYQGKDSTMVLTKVVTEAKDKITGVPQPFNPMMMGQPPQ